MRKKYTDLLEDISRKQDEILKEVSQSTASKAKKYDEISSKLKNIRIKVDKIDVTMRENGNMSVNVKYAINDGRCDITENLKTFSSPLFKAINELGLISFDDSEKIQKAIDRAIKAQKNVK